MIDFAEDIISLNSFQITAQLLNAKYKYLIAGRGTGKSYINGAEIDENVRLMPRGITAITQDTLGQALTKTLPSAFEFLDRIGYRRYNPKTKTGNYVVCQKPPEHFYLPFGSSLSYEYMITFSNGHALYLLSQSGNSRGPSIDYNITDEALTIDKKKFDHETSATNRGKEQIFGKFSPKPIYKHHGFTFSSSMGYLPEHKWLLEPAKYYEEERNILIFDNWNKIVNLQLKIIQARANNENSLAIELYKEAQRLKKNITPFVSKEGVLFMLANAFDGIANKNITFSYLLNQYQTMSLMEFMIEMLNYHISKVVDCYYQIDERHVYFHADNDDYIRGIADNNNFDFEELKKNRHSLFDKDCDVNKPIEITPDWGAKISLIEVAQESDFDFVTNQKCRCDNNINEFFVKPDKNTDTMINLLIDRFSNYYRYHKKKEVIYTIDTYGDLKIPSSLKTYNEHAISRLKRNGWTVTTRRHAGKEPPQNEKYLLWEYLLKEQNNNLPKKRFNGTNCKYTLISMNNTSVIQKPNNKFEKDKRSEARSSVLPEEATHFGDAVDKRIWTKYGKHLKPNSGWVLLH